MMAAFGLEGFRAQKRAGVERERAFSGWVKCATVLPVRA